MRKIVNENIMSMPSSSENCVFYKMIDSGGRTVYVQVDKKLWSMTSPCKYTNRLIKRYNKQNYIIKNLQ